MMQIPVAGVWKRQWEEDPLGDSAGADRDTLVLWTQSKESGIYVDIRLPAESPGISVEAARSAQIVPRPNAIAATGYGHVANRDALIGGDDGKQLDVILRQKSFAGVLDYKDGDTTTSGEALKKDPILAKLANESKNASGGALSLCTCFWRRDLDYQPPSGGLDIGVCASEPPNPADGGSVLLRETGDDASYAEGWLRLPGTDEGPFVALELISPESEGQQRRAGYWVRAGNRFAYAVGRPATAAAADALDCAKGSHEIKDRVGKSLAEAVVEEENASPNEDGRRILDLVGSYLAVAGEIDVPSNRWTILHSTNPELVGCSLVGNLERDELCCSSISLEGTATGAVGDHLVQKLRSADGGPAAPCRRWKIAEVTGAGALPS